MRRLRPLLLGLAGLLLFAVLWEVYKAWMPSEGLVIGSITVLPALLSKMGRWVDRPRVPLLWRLNRRIGRGGVSRHVVGPVVRHPVAALLGGGVLVAALAAPALGMRVHESNLDTLPADIPQVQTFRAMSAAFPSQGARADVVVKAPAAEAARVRDALTTLQATGVRTSDFVDGEDDPIEVSRDRRVTVLHLVMRFDESDRRVDGAVTAVGDRQRLHLDVRHGPAQSRRHPLGDLHGRQ